MAGLISWNPFRTLRGRDEFEDFLRESFRHLPLEAGTGIEPAVEIAETDHDVTVKMQVPGVDKDQLQVSLRDDALSVRGEVKCESEQKKRHFYRQEIRYGAFQREMRLPSEVDATRAKADLKNGMLTVVAPKTAHAKTHRIDVAVH
jgi:HSP20 family protein